FSEVSVVALPPRHDPAAGQATGRLRVDPQRGGATTLSRAVGGRLLVGTLDPGFLWGEPGEMGQAMRICMYAVRTRLFCGGHPGTEPGDRLLTANWDLFLEPDFGVAPWTVVSVSGPGSGFGRYRGVLVPAAIAVLLLAVLLSSFQIRRVLVPLSDLLRRIRALEGGSTDLHRQAGEDEFGLLSRTFGRMQERIGRQMDTLRMLSEVDRLILQGTPLADLLGQVATRMRQLSGCRTVCVVVPDLHGGGGAALFVLGRGADTIVQAPCADVGALPASCRPGWHQAGALPPGCLRDACLDEGVREVLLLATAHERADAVR